MALQTAFIAPNSYETSATTMRRLIRLIAPTYSASLSGTFTLSVVTGQLALTTAAAGFDVVLRGKDTNPDAFNKGSHFVWTDQAETINFEAANSQARWDAVVLRVADPEYGTVVSAGPKFTVIKGTPAASPTKMSDSALESALATEAGPWTRVADVRVPGSATQLTAGSDISVVLPYVFQVQERRGDGPEIAAGSSGAWQNVGWTTPMTVRVPPSGKIRVSVSGNIRNMASSTTWLGYAMTWAGGSISDSDKFFGGVKGTSSDGQAASKSRIYYSFAPPGTIVTITPQSWRPSGVSASDTQYDSWMFQVEACPW